MPYEQDSDELKSLLSPIERPDQPMPFKLGEKVFEVHWLQQKVKRSTDLALSEQKSYEAAIGPLISQSIAAKIKTLGTWTSDVTVNISGSVGMNIPTQGSEFLQHLDTIVIDAKRVLLHSLHPIDRAVREREDDDQELSFEKFLNQVCSPKPGETPRAMVAALDAEVPDYLDFVRAWEGPLRGINHRRTQATHGKFPDYLDVAPIAVQLDGMKLPSDWEEPEILLGGRPVAEFLPFQTKLLSTFRIASLRACHMILNSKGL